MASTNDSSLGHGAGGTQTTLEEQSYPAQAAANESIDVPPKYAPSPKHGPGGWGSEDPIKTPQEGQQLLETGYKDGKQRYNVTSNGTIVKFQPANTPGNEYHSYKVDSPRDIPASVLKAMLRDGKISRVSYSFFDDTHETELSMNVNGINILAFDRNGASLTTRWNLDELAEWLRNFIDHMTEDPYPVEADGEYAAMKDISARDFDSDDEDEFDAYYDKLDEWNLRHRWHPASSGAILADVYFQLIGDEIEISWNNEDNGDGIKFQNLLGGARIKKDVFYATVDTFLKAYANHWLT